MGAEIKKTLLIWSQYVQGFVKQVFDFIDGVLIWSILGEQHIHIQNVSRIVRENEIS